MGSLLFQEPGHPDGKCINIHTKVYMYAFQLSTFHSSLKRTLLVQLVQLVQAPFAHACAKDVFLFLGIKLPI